MKVLHTRQMKKHFCMFIVTPRDTRWFIIIGDDAKTDTIQCFGHPNRRQFSGMCDLFSGEVSYDAMQARI